MLHFSSPKPPLYQSHRISISAEFRNLRWLGQFIEQQSVMGDLLLWAAGNQESKCRLLELRHGEAAT